MTIGLLKEPAGDGRVLLMPELVRKLTSAGCGLIVERGAGEGAFRPDPTYEDAGASVASAAEVLAGADVLLRLAALDPAALLGLKPGTVVLGNYAPLGAKDRLAPIAASGITLFSLESIPRITRAQSMDVLSSQASLAGYKAVLMAASALPRSFPMFMTAAGTVKPAKVLVIGAGVAGLQAIATAKRLGAVIEAFDTRPSVKDQVTSVGGKFIEVPGAIEDAAAGGYAVEQTAEYRQKQQEMLAQAIVKADVVITTAQIPGKQAPLLITRDLLRSMVPGSVIIDLASATGGNTEGVKDNEWTEVEGIRMLGNSNLSATMPEDASRLLSNNMAEFLKLILKDGVLSMDLADPILAGCCVMHGGELTFPAYRQN